MFVETKIRCATKYLKIKGLVKDNYRQFGCQLLSIRGLIFVIALIKCNYVAFGEQNKIIVDGNLQHDIHFTILFRRLVVD